MYPILQALGHWRIENVEPASSLFIEFYQDVSGADFVKLIYKKDAWDEKPIKIFGSEVISLDGFARYLTG